MQHKDSTAAAEILDAQTGNGETPSLYQLLSRYWDRCEALAQAMNVTDRTKDGTPERETADAAQTAIGNEVNELACAICAFVPTRIHEARFKTSFVEMLMNDNGGWTERGRKPCCHLWKRW
jgi:hypothetical protein